MESYVVFDATDMDAYVVTVVRAFPNEENPHYLDHKVECVTAFSTREGAENWMQQVYEDGEIYIGDEDGDPCYQYPNGVGYARLHLEKVHVLV